MWVDTFFFFPILISFDGLHSWPGWEIFFFFLFGGGGGGGWACGGIFGGVSARLMWCGGRAWVWCVGFVGFWWGRGMGCGQGWYRGRSLLIW